MKFILYVVILLMASFNAPAQKIKISSEYDKFTDNKRVETNWCYLKPTMSAPLSVKVRSVGKSIFVTLAGSNVGSNVIGPSATAIFLFTDKTTITATSTGIQSYDYDTKTGKSFKHQYSITEDDLKQLSEKLLLSVRKSDTDSYYDFDIAEKNNDKFKNLAEKFLNEYNK